MSKSSDIFSTCQVDFEPIGKRIAVAFGVTVLEAAQQAGLSLASACGGVGRCGQCRISILSGSVSAPTAEEQMLLTETDMRNGVRLACQTRVQSHLKVQVPSSSLITTQRLQLSGDSAAFTLDPVVRAYKVEAPSPSLHDSRSDLERLRAALPQKSEQEANADPAVIRQISSLARAHEWHITAFLKNTEIIGVASCGSRPVGVAVDVGTTKIAASLLDLETGEELAVVGALNPQISYGEDVISRLAYALRVSEGGHSLAVMVRDTLNNLLAELTERAGVSRDQVTEVCLVGNTAMTHLFLELPVSQLSRSPYVAATDAAVTLKARDLGLMTAPGAYIHVLPCIRGFIGADHVAMILAAQLDHTDLAAVGIDIGTNTEIVLAQPEGMLTSVSCASGPAFEGAHISDGMRAAAGAIEAVTLTETSVQLKTVENAPPIGLCGSGMIDSVAELHRWGIINSHGRFERQHPRVREGRHGPEFLLVSDDHRNGRRDVVITQQDINQIQLAKGAIRAGLDILLEATNTTSEEVSEVIIAGAFGSFLNIQNILHIGMFPDFPHAHYRQVGNAALTGAKGALISCQARKRAWQIARQTRYLELTTHPQFKRRFALGMLFSGKEYA
ncbi:ferredoxin [Candidatus Vecturithrix granuli]|uniref:Ferredoxin n=1 Tax=Vecturithrix granuli TaxID=1499967 RepID=A0A0S6W902_VECG1|nr:ferredoxin [Candidatus Vecturithrix granuli]